jgi:hypothetical protein
MTTETLNALKYSCICGFTTDEKKEFLRHLLKSGRKEKGLHKSASAIHAPNKEASVSEEIQGVKASVQTEETAQVETTPKKREPQPVVLSPARPTTTASSIEWNAPKIKVSKKPKLTECIVIDKDGKWHENTKLDLKGQDMSECTWGYYGKRFPVLVETKGGLKPYIPQDHTGAESPHRLFIAAKSSGYKAYMRIDNSLLRKIQIGMMALLVIGILFLIYILINRNGGNSGDIEAAVLRMVLNG